MKRNLHWCAPAIAVALLAACGGSDDDDGDYREGFDEGFRQGQMTDFEVESERASTELSEAIEAGWLCETHVYRSIESLSISCEAHE